MSRRYQSAILTASYNGLQVPNAPTIGTATAGAGSASVTFTAPSNVGGGAITSYTVISSPGSILGTGASSPITVSGLTNGTAYTFTVVATNAYGSGPASAASNSVTPAVNYIENVFSTYLYTGTGASQTITNGIDLSGKGGLVWLKIRNGNGSNRLVDTVRGGGNVLTSNATNANVYDASIVPTFSSSGFNTGGGIDISSYNYVSWTFREQAKFFDVVTYTGNGTSQNIAHNLGSVPGCIMVKRTDAVGNWIVWHRSLNQQTGFINLESTAASSTNVEYWNNTAPTSSVFSVGPISGTNGSGATYVAYVFAHDAGGFGLTGTDNVVSCGSWTENGSSQINVNLGFEPQWLMIKRVDSSGTWVLLDTMRGFAVTDSNYLLANSTAAETSWGAPYIAPTATGFVSNFYTVSQLGTFIYIAIRRGPMATPTVGTSVFDVDTRAGSASIAKTNSDILTDLAVIKRYTSSAEYWAWTPRLVGNLTLQSNSTDAELSGAMATSTWDTMTGAFCAASNGATNTSTLVDYSFRRAPGFHDVVCYTGTGVVRTLTHNLAAVPELMIVKDRTASANWSIYSATLGATQRLRFNDQAPQTNAGFWNNTAPTSSVFTVGTFSETNESGDNFVAYLFTTCPGVSKVGSYTGTGALQTINCAFTTGARLVLIKRTDSTGDWFTYDSARGITSGNDPYLLLNSTAAETTGTNYVDTTGVGFQVTAAAPAGLNAVGGTYIFLAIA